jgi:AcrR family transcriptional regulator
MYETFEKLPVSKKEQILQVCIEEFAQNGYKNASTNTIVKRLGISKGVLFLYFKNKRNLYLYLVEYLTIILVDDFFKQFPPQGPGISIDVFDNLGEYYKVMIQEKPDYFLFMLGAFMNPPEDLKSDVEEMHNNAHDTILNNLNSEGFRKGVDLPMLVNLLHLVSFFVGQMILKEYKGGNDWVEDIKEHIEHYADIYTKYVDIIKYGVYER